LADGVNTIDICVINDEFHDFVYLIDLDGSFRPDLLVPPTLSTLVASDSKKHMTFVDVSKCTDNTVGCYSYCHDTCFRSMRYLVEDTEQANFTVEVCSRINPSLCSTFKGGRRGNVGPHEFTFHLPIGQEYDAIFINRLGMEVTPSKVTQSIEKTFCPQGEFSVTLKSLSPIVHPVVPPITMPIPVMILTKKPTIPTRIPTNTPTNKGTLNPTIVPTTTTTNEPSLEPMKPTYYPSKFFLNVWRFAIRIFCIAVNVIENNNCH
jgi:hypothetical protein